MNLIARKFTEEDEKGGDIAEVSETVKPHPRSSWITMQNQKKLSRHNIKVMASDPSSSAHFKNESKRRWKVGADITKQLDKIKDISKKRRLDSFNTEVDGRHFRSRASRVARMGIAMGEKHASKIDHAEVEQCVEILRNQRERLDLFSQNSENTYGMLSILYEKGNGTVFEMKLPYPMTD